MSTLSVTSTLTNKLALVHLTLETCRPMLEAAASQVLSACIDLARLETLPIPGSNVTKDYGFDKNMLRSGSRPERNNWRA